jgi:hypothetical protein
MTNDGTRLIVQANTSNKVVSYDISTVEVTGGYFEDNIEVEPLTGSNTTANVSLKVKLLVTGLSASYSGSQFMEDGYISPDGNVLYFKYSNNIVTMTSTTEPFDFTGSAYSASYDSTELSR